MSTVVHFYIRECRGSEASQIKARLEDKFFVHVEDSIPSLAILSILVPRHGKTRFIKRNGANLTDLGFVLHSGTAEQYATLLKAHAAMRPAGNRVTVPKPKTVRSSTLYRVRA